MTKHRSVECLAGLSCAGPPPLRPAIQQVPSGINYFSPFSSLDFRLTKDIRLGERMRLSLIGEAFNIFNFTHVQGLSKNSYSGHNIFISPVDLSTIDGLIHTDLYLSASVAGGFFGSGGA